MTNGTLNPLANGVPVRIATLDAERIASALNLRLCTDPTDAGTLVSRRGEIDPAQDAYDQAISSVQGLDVAGIWQAEIMDYLNADQEITKRYLLVRVLLK